MIKRRKKLIKNKIQKVIYRNSIEEDIHIKFPNLHDGIISQVIDILINSIINSVIKEDKPFSIGGFGKFTTLFKKTNGFHMVMKLIPDELLAKFISQNIITENIQIPGNIHNDKPRKYRKKYVRKRDRPKLRYK